MTLILGMSKVEGIYVSTDYRVTDGRSGKLIDDAAVKFLTVHYPPEDGPRVLLGYTGLAILPDGTPTGTWIRETLRGQNEFINQSMTHLRTRLDRDIARFGEPLVLIALVIEPNRRLVGGLTNLKLNDRKEIEVMDFFGYTMRELAEPLWLASGSGAFRLAERDRDLLNAQVSIKPRKPLDHMKLLATINRRVAVADQRVSPFCQVSFINSDESTSPVSHSFVDPGEWVPFEMPIILHGVDLTEMTREFHEKSAAFFSGGPPPGDQHLEDLNRGLRRRP